MLPHHQPPSIELAGTSQSSVDCNSMDADFTRLKPSREDYLSLSEEMKHLPNNSNEYWYALGSRLCKIHCEALYRGAGYRSFSQYCAQVLGYNRQHVYKLIKVVKFIDKQWTQADTSEQRMAVRRLFSLGF